VLEVSAPPKAEPAAEAVLERPEELEGATYKLKWPGSEHAIYITVNDIVVDGRRRPFEVFINSKNMEHYAWTVALTRMISAVFRRGGEVAFVVDELKAVFDPRGGAWMSGRYVPSILAAIGIEIEKHLKRIGFLGDGATLVGEAQGTPTPVVRTGKFDDAGWEEAPTGDARPTPLGAACPSCGSYEVRVQEGCLSCATCGFSRCG
jgi:ribonucleoside-diphosphate reductase alpha chain